MKRSVWLLAVSLFACGGDDAPLGPGGSSSCVVERVTVAAMPNQTSLDGQCWPHVLPLDAAGHVPCVVVEARKVSACECTDGRLPVAAAHSGVVDIAREDPLAASAGWNCFCELGQLAGDAQQECRTQPAPPDDVPGWCYVDDTTGNPELVDHCAGSERQQIRFAGQEVPAPGATVFMACCDG